MRLRCSCTHGQGSLFKRLQNSVLFVTFKFGLGHIFGLLIHRLFPVFLYFHSCWQQPLLVCTFDPIRYKFRLLTSRQNAKLNKLSFLFNFLQRLSFNSAANTSNLGKRGKQLRSTKTCQIQPRLLNETNIFYDGSILYRLRYFFPRKVRFNFEIKQGL